MKCLTGMYGESTGATSSRKRRSDICVSNKTSVSISCYCTGLSVISTYF